LRAPRRGRIPGPPRPAEIWLIVTARADPDVGNDPATPIGGGRGVGVRPVMTVACVLDPGKLWNPYLQLLQEALGEAGVRYAGGIGFLWWGRYRLIHVHWPEAMARHRHGAAAGLKALLLLGALVFARLRGRGVVWTVHNLQTHEGAARPLLEAAAWDVFQRMVTGVILLTPGAGAEFDRRYPQLADRPRAVIPHGHYRSIVGGPPGEADADPRDGPAPDDPVMIFFGLVRPYKGVRELIEAFNQAAIPRARLVIAGQVQGGPGMPHFPRDIENLAAGNPSIVAQLRQLSNAELTHQLAASNLVVLPFLRVLNSGSVLFALSCNRPVCAPRLGALPELQAEIGTDWLYLYEPPLTPEILKDALRWALEGRRAAAPDLTGFDWPAIAHAHRRFFGAVDAIDPA